jgi:hypothetical protein
MEEKPCRHEYVKIFQRKLKGLVRRLTSLRAYLPVGFKSADLSHLREGSFCFCVRCRARLYPRRTSAQKAAARLALAQSKATPQELEMVLEELGVDPSDVMVQSLPNSGEELTTSQPVNVEELEVTAVDVVDIQADGVKLNKEDDSAETDDEDA